MVNVYKGHGLPSPAHQEAGMGAGSQGQQLLAWGRGKVGWAIEKQQGAGGVQGEILFCKVSAV